MKLINFSISKADVAQEVAKATAYAGAKAIADDPEATFSRVATVEEDAPLIFRYWEETCAGVIDSLRGFVTAADFSGDSLELTLEVSGAYDDTLTPSVGTSLFSAIAAAIAARWFRLTLPEKSEEQDARAARSLSEALRQLYHRRRPSRVKGIRLEGLG